MSLANLYNPPLDPRTFESFFFANADHHTRVVRTIAAKGGPTLTDYVLYPLADFDMQNFLRRHQQAHFDINTALNFASNDISDLNPKDRNQVEAWSLLHAQEHVNWSNSLQVF